MSDVMIRRRDAAQASIDRFSGQAFVLGKVDCARLAAFHLRQCGYRVSLLKGGRYSTPMGARRALERLGAKSLSDVLDAHLPRIAPLRAMTGDIFALRSEDEQLGDALFIAVGNGRALGFVNGACGVWQPKEFVAAWRAPF